MGARGRPLNRVRTTGKEKLIRGSALAGLCSVFIEAALWDRHAKLMVFPLFAILGLVGCILLYRHYRVIRDTPTFEIGWASPGYAELAGTAQLMPGTPLSAPDGTQCCWYGAQKSTKVPGTINWWRDKRRASTEPFLLSDATGVCVVLPEGSGIFSTPHETHWGDEQSRGHADLLLPGDTLYAAGELATLQQAAPELAEKLARLEAPARRGNRGVESMLVLRKPRDGKLFWIANERPETLEANVGFGTWLALAFFLYFALGFAWVIA